MSKKLLLILVSIILVYSVNAATYYCDSCSNCSAQIQVSSGGDVVVLNQSIYNQVGNCISFNGMDDITLDCGGNIIEGDGDSSGYGIWLNDSNGGSNNSIIMNCPNISRFNSGIYIKWPSSNNTLIDITTINNSNSGIYLYWSSKNKFLNITARANGRGIHFESSSNNTFTNLTVRENYFGFVFTARSQNNTIKNSIISNNECGINMMAIMTYYPIKNLIYNNYFSNNSLYNAYIDSNVVGQNYFNATLDCLSDSNIIGGYCVGGNYWSNSTGDFSNTCIDATGDGICDSLYNLSHGTVIAYDYLPLTDVTPGIPCYDCSNCSAEIQAASAGQIIRLNNSIYDHDGTCIDFNGADNITLDCDWNRIEGDGDSTGSGIYLSNANGGSNNNTIKNCAYIGLFQGGVYLKSSSGNAIENLTSSDNSNLGLDFSGSSNNTFTNINLSNNGVDGIQLSTSSNYNFFNNSRISNSSSAGILLGSPFNIFKNTNIYKESRQTGLIISSFSNQTYNVQDIDTSNLINNKPIQYYDGTYRACPNNQILDFNTSSSFIFFLGCENVTVNNTYAADSLQFYATNNSKIYNSRIQDSYYGLILYYSYQNHLFNITATNHKLIGVGLVSSSNNNFSEINVSHNNLYGLYFQSSPNNVVTDSSICYNGDALYDDSSNIIQNNTFCVDELAPSSSWYSSVSQFRFNVSNPLYSSNCTLYVDGSEAGNATSVTQHISTNVSYTVSGSGAHNWNVYCNDSYGNYANSSLFYFNIKKDNAADCSFDYECINGYCVHNHCRSDVFYCGDSYCDSYESCTSCEDDCGKCRSSSRPSSSLTTPPNQKTMTFNELLPQKETKFTITDESYCVNEIKVKVKNKANDVKIKVTKIDTIPKTIPQLSKQSCCISEIEIENIENNDLESATIKFPVEKKWISNNNLDKETVKLNRYSTQWEELETNYVNEDNLNYYFESVTPGFSIFAVTADEVEKQVEELPEIEEMPVEDVHVKPEPEPIQPDTKGDVIEEYQKPWLNWIILAICLVIVLVVAGLMLLSPTKQKKKNNN
ncbi:right-handed parallel beta-helix repeat-containing protein [Candidatus Woesearchaeota archaeon]|nr:right-handed parallel beta-helix repeat-containing protein [Candidatus Woesearchaeota archaeon]